MQKIIITMGLPGSGKTTFAEKYESDNINYCKVNHIEFDKYRENSLGKRRSLENIYLDRTKDREDSEVVILDGLFLTNESISNLINMVKENTVEENLFFEIHCWNVDRDICLYNDKGRRSVDSENTIKHAHVDKLDLNYIKEACGLEKIGVECHYVEKKPLLKLALDKSGLNEEDGFLYSDSWVVGGYYHDRDGYNLSVDTEEPLEFCELEKLVEELVPEISHSKYKKLFQELAEIDYFNDRDYYSCYDNERWKCNLEELMDWLNKEGLISL